MLYLPCTEAKGSGRDEQQEPLDEGVLAFLCIGCCRAALSTQDNKPAWKFTATNINFH